MKKKAVSGMMLIVLLIGMLSVAFNVAPVTTEPEIYHFETEVIPEHPTILDEVYLTISFTFASYPPYVREFGYLTKVDNVFYTWVDIDLGWGEPSFPIIHTDSYTYYLGKLSAGLYRFEVHVYMPPIFPVVHSVYFTVTPAISATIDIDPNTLNLKSKGQWITVYIQLPEGYNPENIDVTAILLNETIQPVLDPMYDFVTNASEYIVDHDGDGVLERMVKFNRTEVASWIYDDLGIQYGNVTLTIKGELSDGTPFEGADIIKVLFPGDADDDGDVDSSDLYIFSRCYGMSIENPGYNPLADFNEDGYINSEDLYILSRNYGKTAV